MNAVTPAASSNTSSGSAARTAGTERRVRRGEPGDRHAVRRARHVVEADFGTELDGRGVAAVLTADTELDVGPRRAPFGNRDRHQLADPVDIDLFERTHPQE